MTMTTAQTVGNCAGLQPEPVIQRYYSVEFAPGIANLLYQFKLWRSDQETMFMIVKKDSPLLSRLAIGRVFDMKYYSHDSLNPVEYRQTRIASIADENEGRFQGHYRVALSIVEETSPTVQ